VSSPSAPVSRASEAGSRFSRHRLRSIFNRQPCDSSLTESAHWSPFGLAGLWENWRNPATGEWVRTFCIITTAANELVGRIHDRMPAILRPEKRPGLVRITAALRDLPADFVLDGEAVAHWPARLSWPPWARQRQAERRERRVFRVRLPLAWHSVSNQTLLPSANFAITSASSASAAAA